MCGNLLSCLVKVLITMFCSSMIFLISHGFLQWNKIRNLQYFCNFKILVENLAQTRNNKMELQNITSSSSWDNLFFSYWSLPVSFWLDVVYATIFTINRLPTTVLMINAPVRFYLHRSLIMVFLNLLGVLVFHTWAPLLQINYLLCRFSVCFSVIPLITRAIDVWIPKPIVFIQVTMFIVMKTFFLFLV